MVIFAPSRYEEVKSSYHLLVKALEERYGVKEFPGVGRQQVLAMKQKEGEFIGDFIDKILNKVSWGDDGVLQSLAVDAFLSGRKDWSATFFGKGKGAHLGVGYSWRSPGICAQLLGSQHPLINSFHTWKELRLKRRRQ